MLTTINLTEWLEKSGQEYFDLSTLPSKIIVTYDGQGDSGSIEGAEALIDGKLVSYSLPRVFREIVYSMLPGGFGNDSGSSGTLTFDISDCLLSHEHVPREYEASYYFDTDGLDDESEDDDHGYELCDLEPEYQYYELVL